MTREEEIVSLSENIKSLQEEIKRLDRERTKRFGEFFGVEVGSLVRCTRTGAIARVTAVRPLGWGSPLAKPWLMGIKRLKDGSWSAVERHLYSDWELITEDSVDG